jgi:L-ribulose-5-phosphate 3-epimerase
MVHDIETVHDIEARENMNPIALNSASLFAREVDYSIAGDIVGPAWLIASRATEKYFRRNDTFPVRFGELLDEVERLGFDHLALWCSQLHWRWASEQQVEAAVEALASRGLTVVSLAGSFGDTIVELEAACRLATALGCTILGGRTSLLDTDPRAMEKVLEQQGVVFAYENHPEKTAAETLKRLGDCDPRWVAVDIDTGWFGTHGFDAAEAISIIGNRVHAIDLKDVTEPGIHKTCRFGDGVVPLQACVRELVRLGYQGPICVEHNAGGHDPGEDIVESRELLVGWLKTEGANG